MLKQMEKRVPLSPQLLMKLELKIKVLKEKYFDVELLTIALFRGNSF
jgi:hypothetical protein